MPEPLDGVQKHRNSVTAFDSDALSLRRTHLQDDGGGVWLTDVDGLGASTALTVLTKTSPDLAAIFATEKAVRSVDDTGLAQTSLGQAHTLPYPIGQPGGQGVSPGGASVAQQQERAGQLPAPLAGTSRHLHRNPGHGLQLEPDSSSARAPKRKKRKSAIVNSRA